MRQSKKAHKNFELSNVEHGKCSLCHYSIGHRKVVAQWFLELLTDE